MRKSQRKTRGLLTFIFFMISPFNGSLARDNMFSGLYRIKTKFVRN